MIGKLIRKFESGGFRGIHESVSRKLFSPPVHPIDVALDIVTREPGYSIIQLGAFTGNTENDPLFGTLRERLRQVSGRLIVVEPVRCFYDELVRNYEGTPGVYFENVAVSGTSGQTTLCRLGVDPVAHGHPSWLSQLSSLKAERMTDLWDRYESDAVLKQFYLEHRIQETVECITFEELMKRHSLNRLDLLQMDVEGCEMEILKSIDFARYPIRFVNYESVLLHKDKPKARELMCGWGYHQVDCGQDTFCYRASDRNLRRIWNRRGCVAGGR